MTSVARELALIVFASPAWFVAMVGFASAAENTGPGLLINIDQVPYVFDIVVDPAEPDSVLLATRGGLYQAWPNGAAERISQRQTPFWGITVGPNGVSRLYARSPANDGGATDLAVSSDRGRSWQGVIRSGGKIAHLRLIEASKTSSGSFYGAGHEFWRSADGGLNWEFIGIPPSRVLDLAASARGAQRIFAATMSDLHVSDDGGRSWRPTGGARCRLPVMAVDTGADGAVYAFSLCAGLIRGDEATDVWTVVNDRFGGCIIQHLAVDPRNSKQAYAVLGCRKVLASVDAGLTWRTLGSQRAWEPDCETNSTGHPEPNDG